MEYCLEVGRCKVCGIESFADLSSEKTCKSCVMNCWTSLRTGQVDLICDVVGGIDMSVAHYDETQSQPSFLQGFLNRRWKLKLCFS
jgi:hypothetical protein